MALSACRECGHEVSSAAASCPNCGVPDPTRGDVPRGSCLGCGEDIAASSGEPCPHCGVEDPLTPQRDRRSEQRVQHSSEPTPIRAILLLFILIGVVMVFQLWRTAPDATADVRPGTTSPAPVQHSRLARTLAPKCPDADAAGLDRMAARGSRTFRDEGVTYRDGSAVGADDLLDELEAALEGLSASPQDCSTMIATIMVMVEQGTAQRPASRNGSATTLPSGVRFSVISQDVFADRRRSLDVRISRPVTEDVLETIARQLRDEDGRSFPRTYIAYYLPGMEVDGGAWATSYFTPDLEVRVLGQPAEAQTGLDRLRGEHGAALLGAWDNSQPGLSSRYVLLHENGSFKMQRIFPDGSARAYEVVEAPSDRGRRFADPTNQFGEYFVVRPDRLELWDAEGVVFTAQPVR